MTFTSYEEPIYAIYQLHRVIVLHAVELTRKIEKEHSEPRLSFSERSLNTNSVIEVQKEAINFIALPPGHSSIKAVFTGKVQD